MKKFKLNWLEKKTSAKGLSYIKASIVPEGEQEITDVAIFSSFPDFANLMPGQEVMGELEIKQNGQYTNKSLVYPPTTPSGANRGSGGAYKTKLMNEMVEKKQEGIRQSQENKELGIKISSVNNKAVDCAISEFNYISREGEIKEGTLKLLTEKWRKYLWLTWDTFEKFDLPFVSNEKELEPDLPPDEAYENM